VNARANEAMRRGSRKTERGERAERKAGGRRCPICGKPTVQEYRPFCSKHCADIDLGRWLDGRYAVPGEPLGAEKDDEDDKKD
jgi:endogenous inhibitor of DNA gyrase (YacG/DUF329 family)